MSQTSDTPMTPQERAINAALFYDKWLNDSSLETWFPITAEELKKLQAELAAAKAQIEKLKRFVSHGANCATFDYRLSPCTCGLSQLLEEIKA